MERVCIRRAALARVVLAAMRALAALVLVLAAAGAVAVLVLVLVLDRPAVSTRAKTEGSRQGRALTLKQTP